MITAAYQRPAGVLMKEWLSLLGSLFQDEDQYLPPPIIAALGRAAPRYLPVATIARNLGFSEATNFGKHFARIAGSSPGEFRRTQPGLW